MLLLTVTLPQSNSTTMAKLTQDTSGSRANVKSGVRATLRQGLSGGEFLLNRSIVLHRFAVLEGNA
ncbi:hypothetical protein, partial [Burkholderia gladioli]|uniref:hypothetical protein n=1 Tax=Burkholderia gladioli TaxID=28095 RepID=UPI001ABB2C5E